MQSHSYLLFSPGLRAHTKLWRPKSGSHVASCLGCIFENYFKSRCCFVNCIMSQIKDLMYLRKNLIIFQPGQISNLVHHCILMKMLLLPQEWFGYFGRLFSLWGFFSLEKFHWQGFYHSPKNNWYWQKSGRLFLGKRDTKYNWQEDSFINIKPASNETQLAALLLVHNAQETLFFTFSKWEKLSHIFQNQDALRK